MTAFTGTVVYEFKMQIRRRAVWISIAAVLLLMFALFSRTGRPEHRLPDADFALFLASNASFFMPIVFGILIADRWRRDKSLGTGEVLDSMPSGYGARVWGKYLGATLATIVPLFLAYAVNLLYLSWRFGDVTLIRFLPFILIAVVTPGLLFVAAFSIACSEWLPVPLYAVLFTGYWFWGNLVQPSRMPTLNCTPLTPLGEYPAAAFFQHTDVGCFQGRSIPILLGLESIALMLAIGALALALLQVYVSCHADRR